MGPYFFNLWYLFRQKKLLLFYIIISGDNMVIYLDIIFLINFFFDFLLLLSVNIVLKRYSRIYKIILGALFGSISLISLFISFNAFILFLFKICLGLIMCLISFGYKNLHYTMANIIYLLMISIILGGFLYYLKIEFSYKRTGLIFYYQGLSFNYSFLIIITPIILYVFIKSLNVLKEVKNYYYHVKIILDNQEFNLTGFLDTGNRLKDPVTNKAIILLNKKLVISKIKIRSPMYVPYNTIKGHELLECIKPQKIWINNQEVSNYLIGLANNSFKLNGIECLLNYKILEDINL